MVGGDPIKGANGSIRQRQQGSHLNKRKVGRKKGWREVKVTERMEEGEEEESE